MLDNKVTIEELKSKMIINDSNLKQLASVQQSKVGTSLNSLSSSNFVGNTSDVFESILKDLENSHTSSITVMGISQKYKVQHRRVYDFFSLMSSLGACKSIEQGKLTWIGVKNIKNVLKESYAVFEQESIHKNNIRLIFQFGKSPSLGTLAKNFLCLFFFLGVNALQMQKVVRLLYDKKSDMKSIERRMYMALKFLEIMGLIAHTEKSSEYKLLLSEQEVVSIVNFGMNMKKEMLYDKFGITIETLLNRFDKAFLKSLNEQRCKDFDKLLVVYS